MGVKGQFFIISTIIIILAISSTLLYLVFPFGLSVKEMNRASSNLINAKNFLLSLEESQVLFENWEEPMLNNKLTVELSNDETSVMKGLFSLPVNLKTGANPESLRVISDGKLVLHSFETPLSSNDVLFFEVSIPPLQTQVFNVYYPLLNESFKKPESNKNIVFDSSTNTTMTRFYSARVNPANGGVIESLINNLNGNELVSGGGLFNIDFAGYSQNHANMSVINWRNRKQPASQIVSFNLTNGFNVNVEVVYEFFNEHIRVRYTSKDFMSEHDELGVNVHVACSHNWTAESSNGTVIQNFCSNSSGFTNKKTGEDLALYSSEESLAFLTPERDAWGEGITFIDLTQIAFLNSQGLKFNFSFDDSTNVSSVELIAFIDASRTSSAFSKEFKKVFQEANVSTDEMILSSKEQGFLNTLDATTALAGGSVFIKPAFHESVFLKNTGQTNWFKQSWNVTQLRVREDDYLKRVDEVVSYSFSDYFTDFFVVNSSGARMPSAVVRTGEQATVYFLADVSARGEQEYFIYRANNSLVPLQTGKGNLAVTDDGMNVMFFNDFFNNITLNLEDNTITNLTVNNSVVEGVMNDFRIGVNNILRSLSTGDFEVVDTYMSNNNLFAQVTQFLRLKADNNIRVESTYTFFDDYFVVKRVFIDNSTLSDIRYDHLFWGSNATSFPRFQGENMSDQYYEGVWNPPSYYWDPPITDGPDDDKYFSVMYWDNHNLSMTTVALVDESLDPLDVEFGLAKGGGTSKQMPYWAQSGVFVEVGLEVAVKFDWGSMSGVLNSSESFYEKFSNPLSVNRVLDYADYTNHFDNLMSISVNNLVGSGLVDYPLELGVDGVEGSVTSLRLANNNERVPSQLINSEFSSFVFNKGVKNYDLSTPVSFAFYNPINSEFEVNVDFSGNPNINYSIINPAGFVYEKGLFNAPKKFSVVNASPGFYVFQFQSEGGPSARADFNVNSTLTQGCLLSNNFGFSGNRMFLFYAPESSSSLSFDLDSSGAGAVWKYSIYDGDFNYLTGDTFLQGVLTPVVYNFNPSVNGRFFWISFEYTNPSQEINWLTFSLKSGLFSCAGSGVRYWINYHAPDVKVLSYFSVPEDIDLEFNVLTQDYALAAQNYSSQLLWDEAEKKLNNGFLFVDYDNLSFKTVDSVNWLDSWITNKSVVYVNFSNVFALENGSLRKVVSADSGDFRYYFITYEGKDFFKVLLTDYSFDNSLITITLDGMINGTDDYWYKFRGHSEGLITGSHALSFKDVKCDGGYTYFGKKDSYSMLAVVLPCDSLGVSDEVMRVSGNSVSFKISSLKDNFFYVMMHRGYKWDDVEEFMQSLAGVKERSSRIEYDWSYYSDELVIT
jgi:hypothetical protein